MSLDTYSERVRTLFAAAEFAGTIADGVSVRLAEQDVQVELSCRCDGERISDLKYRVWGCPHLIAAAEAFCTGYRGQRVAHFLDFSASGLMQTLAVPAEKTGRILVLEDAVRALGAAVRDASKPPG